MICWLVCILARPQAMAYSVKSLAQLASRTNTKEGFDSFIDHVRGPSARECSKAGRFQTFVETLRAFCLGDSSETFEHITKSCRPSTDALELEAFSDNI